MKLAIMQPYFLPYIGYFQLMKAADTFVIYDDVTYIKQGWINRNRILLNKKDFMISLEIRGASSFKKINTVEVGNNRAKLLKTIIQAYKKAPFFEEHKQLIFSLFQSEETNLAKYISFIFSTLNEYLDINTSILISSEIAKDNSLKGQEKVIEICKSLKANTYINSIGGKELYSKQDFLVANIELQFIKPLNINYPQFGNEFIPWLSIIDVLMFNNKAQLINLLKMYELD